MASPSMFFKSICLMLIVLITITRVKACKVFNVFDYGAVGDGLTDDSQACIYMFFHFNLYPRNYDFYFNGTVYLFYFILFCYVLGH